MADSRFVIDPATMKKVKAEVLNGENGDVIYKYGNATWAESERSVFYTDYPYLPRFLERGINAVWGFIRCILADDGATTGRRFL